MSDNIADKYRYRMILMLTAWLALMVPAVGLTAGSETESGYAAVDGPCNLKFPEDHGGHPGFRTEWWYYTGNLTSDQGRQFGYQLTIFRRQISPPDAVRRWPDPASKWRTQHIYLGHAALTDITEGRHLYSETTARGALGLAGAERKGDVVNVSIQDWSIRIRPDTHRLKAGSAAFAFDLDLTPVKNPVLHGDKGYSRKGRSPQQASCYYSFSRLAAQGSIKLNEKDFAVAGLSWMDHEFSTAPLEPGTIGWDWFSLQLTNQTELMVFLLRHEDGTVSPASSGTYINRQGASRHLTAADLTVTVLDDWKSFRTNAVYPARWRVEVPALELALTVVPNLADQELQTGASTNVTYWEGSVSATGRVTGESVQGQGYVELNGYAGKFEAPM
jgi:predicted secreted hydrolase